MSTVPVSLYVPCYNGEAYIGRCLDALLALDPAPDEIMVIDDGCTDKTVEIVQRYPSVRILSQGVNKGLSAGRNRGLREAKNNLVASVDADVLVSKDWLGGMMRLIEEFPDASGYGGRLIETVTTTLGDRWRCAHLRQEWGPERVKPRFLVGANTIMRRDDVQAAGGFNEALRTNGEDVDLGERLAAAGHYLVYEPSITCYHLRSDTVKSALRMHWQWYRNPHYARNPPKSWYQLIRFIRKCFRSSCKGFRRDDLRAGKLDLFFISLIAYPHHAWHELQMFLRQRKKQAI